MLPTGVLATCILLLEMGLCPVSFALPPDAVGDCTVRQVVDFTESIPNSEECINAGLEVIVPRGQSIKNLSSALPVFCTAECGGVMANFLAHKCNDHSFAFALAMTCLQTNGSYGEYCRYSYIDLILQNDFTSVESCLEYNSTNSTCPSGCSAALHDVVDQLGCCYQMIYNISNEIATRYISQDMEFLISERLPSFPSITDPSLWSDCGVDLVEVCTGIPFPNTTEGSVGKCSSVQVQDYFEENFSEECLESHYELRMSSSVADINSLDIFCTTTCGLALGKFLEETCFTPLLAVGINVTCSGEDETRRCATVFENEQDITTAFSSVALYCSEFETSGSCPDDCAHALITLSSVLGCCYQSVYNDSGVMLLNFISGQIDIETRRFLDFVGDEELWDTCNVALIEECGREPFSGSLQAVLSISSLAGVLLVLMEQLPF